ncbi:MAG TPA: tetratricopeptide repeat protein [Gemmatimonadales bacterium]|nr:tetratricopeptide repeat protein [Gemmatimonadales bacterium]
MSRGSEFPPLRVEQALNLLPDLDALVPLRALLVSTSRAVGPGISPESPDRTVGKRQLELDYLRSRLPQAVARVSHHFSSLYEAALAALEAEQRGDLSAAVEELIRSGNAEQQVGRFGQARLWYDHALRVAEFLRDRRPEVRVLLAIARLEQQRGRLDQAGRCCQRALVLAEAESDRLSVALACEGLGNISLTTGQAVGAGSWFSRGMEFSDEPGLTARFALGLAEVARRRKMEEVAMQRLDQARRAFTELRDSEGLARALLCQGRLSAGREKNSEALASLQEALACLRDAPGRQALEIEVRLEIGRIYLAEGRLLDVEHEVRRAEELAIAHNLTRALASLYLLLGEVRQRQGDDSGFVFFENAIALCRGAEPARDLEGAAYLAYARFRRALGDADEARACLERGREILESLGDSGAVARAGAEMAELPTP